MSQPLKLPGHLEVICNSFRDSLFYPAHNRLVSEPVSSAYHGVEPLSGEAPAFISVLRPMDDQRDILHALQPP